MSSQTSSDPLPDPPHPCDGIASCGIRPLLQEHCTLHSNPRLCDSAGHRSGTDAHPRPLLFHARSRHDDPPELALRDGLRILANGHDGAESPFAISHARRDCAILFSHPAAQILTAPSASLLALFSSAKRTHNHCLQLWTHPGRHNMAYSAWTGVHCICGGLESSA